MPFLNVIPKLELTIQTASTYERMIPFTIKNDGSATFFFDWHYNGSPVKKYLQISVEPKNGHVTPGNEVDCTLHFTLKQVPVQAFPVTLSVSVILVYMYFYLIRIKSLITDCSSHSIKCFF